MDFNKYPNNFDLKLTLGRPIFKECSSETCVHKDQEVFEHEILATKNIDYGLSPIFSQIQWLAIIPIVGFHFDLAEDLYVDSPLYA